MLEGKNRYCGPAVVAELLRTDTDTAAQYIRSISGQRRVTGTYASSVAKLIWQRGGELNLNYSLCGKRCWQIVRGCPLSLLVVTTSCGGGHFMLAHRSKLFDNHSKRWVKAKDHIHRNATVRCVYEISKKPKKV